jgi:ribosome-binding protein aMBF1 (putative translation factor)
MLDRTQSSSANAFAAIRHAGPSIARAEEALGSRLALARNVLVLRTRRGITQTQLAAELGVKQPRVAEIEAARANVQLDTLDRLPRVFGVEPCALLRAEKKAAPLVHT